MPILTEHLTVGLGGLPGLSDPSILTFNLDRPAEGCGPSFIGTVSCLRCLGGQGSVVESRASVDGIFTHPSTPSIHLLAQVHNLGVASDPSLTPKSICPPASPSSPPHPSHLYPSSGRLHGLLIGVC